MGARTRCVILLASGLTLLSAVGCGGDATSPSAQITLANAYWALQLNQHTAQLALAAPQNIIQLTATPLNGEGNPLRGLGAAHYTASDSSVTVDATGRVTAQFVTSGFQNAFVVASLTDTVQHVTLVDTCFIQVTGTPPNSPLATFTFQPLGSSGTMPLGQFFGMTVNAADATGNAVSVIPYFTSSDSNLISIDRLTGAVTSKRVGQVTLYATTWAYGVAKRDSIVLGIVDPVKASIQVLAVTPTGSTQPVLTFWPQVMQVGVGAVISWTNPSFTDSIDVVFDDPTNVDSVRISALFRFGTGQGNIAPWVKDTTGGNDIVSRICIGAGGVPPECNNLFVINFGARRQRSFPVAGTYRYHSAKWGTSGTIVVQ